MSKERQDWHRLFGVSWLDLCTDQPLRVDTELDLSARQQFLDVALVRKSEDPLTIELPDGFEDLPEHNLITFKSHQEALDDEAILELLGHDVNYRKQNSTIKDQRLSQADCRLFAVTARHPQNLSNQVTLTPIRQGVFSLRAVTREIRIIVVQSLPQTENNAFLHLFSANKTQLAYGKRHHRLRSRDTTRFLYQLFTGYLQEDMDMPIDLQEFVRQTHEQILKDMTPEERTAFLKTLSPEQRLAGLAPEERLAGLSDEEIEAVLKARKEPSTSQQNPSQPDSPG
jgi:hypothetical protein